MEDTQGKATVGTENPRTVKLAKRKLVLQGIIQRSIFPWLEIPAQDHPRAPNPHDDYSKRAWEKAMMAYRREIREKEKTANCDKKKTIDLQHQANDTKSNAVA